MKRIAVLVLGVVISVVSLYYALKGFDLNHIWDSMRNVQVGFFLLMIVPYILTFMTKVWRWRVLLHPDGVRISTSFLLAAIMIQYIPLPFRAGELGRIAVTTVKTGIPAPRVVSTVLVEKVLDVLTLLLMLGIALPFVTLPEAMKGSATTAGAGFLGVALALLLLVLKPDIAKKLVWLVASRLPAHLGPRIDVITDHALEGLAPMSNPRLATKVVLWSLATWGVNAVTIYFLMRSFNVDATPMAAVTVMVAANLGMAVPSAPGYVGPFEFAVVTALTVLGVAQIPAQTFAIIYHFIALVPVATLGIIAALQQGVGITAFRPAPPVDITTPSDDLKAPDALGPTNGAVGLPPTSTTEPEPTAVGRDKR